MEFKPFKIGKYLLLEKLATGGMAEVYRAKSSGAGGFEKQLAIKRILPNYSENEEFRRMFEYEARLSSMLTHSNIVQVYDFTKVAETYLLAMEYVDGKNLRQFVNKSKKNGFVPPLEFSIYVISEVCKGLDYAHKKRDDLTGKPLNIIHRDMSPQNVMLSYDGAVKIVDFGIAKAKDRVNETRSGVIKGKFGYMSPEQANGEEVDHRTDIFSTGIILFEMLTGRRLFTAENDMATLRQIQECNVPSPSRINPKISNDLERILLKSLTKDRNLRYQDAGVFHRSLLEFANKHFPSFTQREVADILQTTFKEEIETEKKRFEQVYRQSIPFSQGAGEAPASEDLGDIDEVLEEVVTRSELGAKTGVTFADELPESEEKPVASEKLDSTSYAPIESMPDIDLSVGGGTQGEEIEHGKPEIPDDSTAGNSEQANLPPSLSVSQKPNRGEATVYEMPLARANERPVATNTEPSPQARPISIPSEPLPRRPAATNVGTQTNSGPTFLQQREPAAPGLDLKVSSSRREPTRREKTLDDEPAKKREPRGSLFSSRMKLGMLAALTLYLYKIYLDGDVPALIEKIQNREITQVESALAPLIKPPEPAPLKPPVQEVPAKVAPTTGGDCLLEVDSDPRGADVVVADQKIGFTPTTVTNRCGQALNVTLKLEGYETESQNIVLQNSTSSLFSQLKKVPIGRLEITANQIAEVLINNEPAGEVSPGQRFEIVLRAGKKYKVKLVNRIYGLEASDEVSISEGSLTRKFFPISVGSKQIPKNLTRPRKTK